MCASELVSKCKEPFCRHCIMKSFSDARIEGRDFVPGVPRAAPNREEK